MFILANINVNSDMVAILDTKDGVTEVVSLYQVAIQVINNKLKIAGINEINKAPKGSIPIPNYGIAINITNAKKSMVKYLVEVKHVDKQIALHQVGLV